MSQITRSRFGSGIRGKTTVEAGVREICRRRIRLPLAGSVEPACQLRLGTRVPGGCPRRLCGAPRRGATARSVISLSLLFDGAKHDRCSIMTGRTSRLFSGDHFFGAQ